MAQAKSIHRSEQPAEAVPTQIDEFYGTGVAAQVIELTSTPKLPLFVFVYDSAVQKWEKVAEDDYTIIEGARIITFSVGFTVPLESGIPSNKNIAVVYNSRSGGAAESNALSPAAITIELRGPNPTGTGDIAFSPSTGRGNITKIIVVRLTQVGTVYTPNTRSVELFDVPVASVPVTDNINTLYLDESLEPAVSGRLINKVSGSGVPGEQFNKILVVALTVGNLGVVSVSMTADGGAGDSEEDYAVRLGGEELA